ncbi:hypothetical protein ACFVZH_20725 [Streptomyces sp. NPDC059534]|uniref:hypothetical protein n=1 Tax=Streptomyces sp. NPDC059534 TaxID=3346859 RepID=UPI00367CCA97
MTFEYRDYYGDHLTARPTAIAQRAGEPPLPAVGIQIENGTTLFVPAARVEEVIAGIRDAARQTTAAPAAKPVPCGQCGAPWSDSHGQPGDWCTPGGRQADVEAAPWTADGRHGPTPEEMADRRIPTCYVQFMGGAHCAKPFGHRPPGSDDPHVPAVGQPAEAQPADEAHVRWSVESRYPRGGTVTLPAVNDRAVAEDYLKTSRETSPEATHRLVRVTTTWTAEEAH